METDLNNCIKKGNILKDVHKRFILYQLLRAVKYIHSGNVIHRDLKPSNVLLNSDCLVKLCDFGLTRSLTNTLENRTTSMESFIDGDDDYDNPVLTEYVATRWYRAPEILLASNRYTKYVDIWSLGCILGEMLLGKALFPGTSTINQIERIISVMERPTIQDIECLHSDYGRSVLDKALQKPYRRLRTLFSNNTEEQALNLLENMIQLNPEKRFTVEQALNHSYVENFRDPSSEIVLKHPVTPILRDDKQLSVSDYRQKLYEIIVEKKAQHKMRKMLRSVELNENKTTGNSLASKKELNHENTSENKSKTDLINQNINRVGCHDPKLSNTNQQYKATETVNQYQCRSDLNETKSLSDSYNSRNQGSTNINHNVSISSPVNHIKYLHSNGTLENEHTSQSSVYNQNSVRPINYCHTNNKQQIVNTPSTSSLITPSKLYSPSFSNYNQTYGTISLSQLHQLHTRKWAN
ncbi:unnamed protein product [Schistosoma curassoni]|nr:unnamed protein product [Schistosoma curassoni]